MMKATHKLVGGSTGFVAGLATGLPLTVAAVISATAALSSSIPDNLEGPPQWLSKRAKFLARFWPRLPHRTVTHWPALQIAVISAISVAVVLLSPLSESLVVVLASGILVGCVMHSVADSMTVHPSGIQLLWPVSRRGFHLLHRPIRIRVGTKSRSEWAFVLIWSLIMLSFTYALVRNSISS